VSEEKKTLGAAVLGWWATSINAETGTARKARAQLRRASSPAEVLAMEATHELHKRIAAADGGRDMSKGNSPLRLAMIAATIAGVDSSKTDRSVHLPVLFGKTNGDNRLLSELRFQRILRANDDWTLAVRLRRALPIVGRNANVAMLGNDLFHWGDTVKSRWCFDYFGAPPPASLQSDKTENPETEDA